MRFFSVIPFLLVFGCASRPFVEDVVLTDLENEEVRIAPQNNSLTVVYFLSPECPLCLNYTLAMRTLEQDFSSDSVKFYGVFSKEWFSPEDVRQFQLKYQLSFAMLFDTEMRLAKALSATVTPEVFVLNSDGTVLYSGLIDNWVNELGKKKLAVSEHYLKDALTASHEGNPIETKHTKAIGCLIE